MRLRGGHRYHYPEQGTRDDLPAGTVNHATPYPHGTHATCAGCGRPIVFIEGYAFRRDYWRAARRNER